MIVSSRLSIFAKLAWRIGGHNMSERARCGLRASRAQTVCTAQAKTDTKGRLSQVQAVNRWTKSSSTRSCSTIGGGGEEGNFYLSMPKVGAGHSGDISCWLEIRLDWPRTIGVRGSGNIWRRAGARSLSPSSSSSSRAMKCIRRQPGERTAR